jgi:flagellar hook-basal body complex protein FliE
MIEGVVALGTIGAPTGPSVAPGAGAAATSPAGGASFDQVLGKIADDAIGVLRGGEAAAIQGLEGSQSPFKVVEAVMSAQRTLQAALAIRDKAVAAYQEISRMPI